MSNEYYNIINNYERYKIFKRLPYKYHKNYIDIKMIFAQETISGMNEELNFYKKEIQTLRSEKDTLEDVLNRKAGDIRKNLANEVLR